MSAGSRKKSQAWRPALSTVRFLRAAQAFPVARHRRGKPRICRVCRAPVVPPRRTLCSRKCTQLLRFFTYTGVQRGYVQRRDRGICALCGCDTHKLRRICRHADHLSAVFQTKRKRPGREVIKSLGFRPGRSLWQADHILPVCEGGGVDPRRTIPELIANLRTLCVPCHRDETALLARRRRAQRGLTKAS